MYQEDFELIAHYAQKKDNLLTKNPLGFFMASVLAGIFIGLGIVFIYVEGGMVHDLPYYKILMGATFGVALSLTVAAGAELFTGNNMVMAAGAFNKYVPWKRVLKLWGVCYIGNLIGSIALAFLFWGAGLAEGATGEFIAETVATKMNTPMLHLFLRGVLCNILVCAAMWCSYKSKSEVGKLIMVFWCLFAFITSGYEHSIANMCLLTVGLLNPVREGITIGGYIYNILTVTMGNMVGGILVIALPYFIISRSPKKEETL